MALTSSSTIDEIITEYVDASGYDIDGSVANCKLFIRACRILLLKRPDSVTIDGVSTRFDAKRIEAQQRRAEAYLAANDTSARKRSARYWDMGDLRT